jgi:uncharacterized low-complexity protein
MKVTNKTLALAVSSAFVASIAATSVHAAENPFALKSLSSGYMVADADKMKDGKCGTGKCSAEKMKTMKDGKCGTGKCSAEKAKDAVCGAEASCAAEKAGKAKEAACSASKAKEGSCNH